MALNRYFTSCTNKNQQQAQRKHGDSEEHKKAVESAIVPKTIATIRVEMNSKAVEGLMKRFRSVYWLCKNELSLNMFEHLIELEELNGAYQGFENLFGAKSQYSSHRFVSDAVRSIAHVIRAKIISEKVNKSPVLGVIVDESTDIVMSSQMIVYYRLCNFEGKKEVVFAGVEQKHMFLMGVLKLC
eukprot:Pompholyxophrys_punicea_v1_NODE_450_length_1903_cov_5.312102.p2 type:complete len:185 gc:universal NODE_450_length_1903_cov_5.312102:1756-1202(-)